MVLRGRSAGKAGLVKMFTLEATQSDQWSDGQGQLVKLKLSMRWSSKRRHSLIVGQAKVSWQSWSEDAGEASGRTVRVLQVRPTRSAGKVGVKKLVKPVAAQSVCYG